MAAKLTIYEQVLFVVTWKFPSGVNIPRYQWRFQQNIQWPWKKEYFISNIEILKQSAKKA